MIKNVRISKKRKPNSNSETYYFKNFEEFVKIFRKETLYRIPIFEIIERMEKRD